MDIILHVRETLFLLYPDHSLSLSIIPYLLELISIYLMTAREIWSMWHIS